MRLGRIDFDTTANIGIISGGTATNIVPKKVVLEGEARSHDIGKLKAQTDSMRSAVKQAVEEYKASSGDSVPHYEEEIYLDYAGFGIDEGDELISRCKRAARRWGAS